MKQIIITFIILSVSFSSFGQAKKHLPESIQLQIQITNIKPGKGTYAILCFQDLNQNKKLDFNNYIPDEPWGLSNNISIMGLPTWQNAQFDLQENQSIFIKLF